MKQLFESFKIKGLEIKNRVCVPPMVCFNFSDGKGNVTDKNVEHYKSVAKGGFGLVIVEATVVSEQGMLHSSQLGLWNDSQIDGHKRIVEAVHSENTPVVLQVHHAGVMSPREDRVSSFEYNLNGNQARALTFEEIVEIENHFADTALRAQKAGYDGVELHGAHNYLITQFMNSRVNKRTDAYGEDRALFVKNIVKKIRAKVGEDFVVGIRMGVFEPTLQDGVNHAKIFESIGIDFLNVSGGFRFEADPEKPDDFPLDHLIYGAGEVKKAVNIPVFAVYEINSKQKAEQTLELTNVDMVCIGRGVLVNYNWANDAKENKDVGKCLYCPNCFWRSNHEKCPGRILYNRNKA